MATRRIIVEIITVMSAQVNTSVETCGRRQVKPPKKIRLPISAAPIANGAPGIPHDLQALRDGQVKILSRVADIEENIHKNNKEFKKLLQAINDLDLKEATNHLDFAAKLGQIAAALQGQDKKAAAMAMTSYVGTNVVAPPLQQASVRLFNEKVWPQSTQPTGPQGRTDKLSRTARERPPGPRDEKISTRAYQNAHPGPREEKISGDENSSVNSISTAPWYKNVLTKITKRSATGGQEIGKDSSSSSGKHPENTDEEEKTDDKPENIDSESGDEEECD